MSEPRLTLACGSYDLLRGLIEGSIAPPGIDLNVLTMASPERHGRMLRHVEFDVCELSLVAYLVARDQGRPFTAIPVFPHRRFRHGYMVKRTGCAIDRPADLNGKRVGLDTLQNSAGLWMRGILQDHYGVDLKSIEWWCQEEEDVPFEPAKWMKVRRVPKGKNIDELLVAGELEGALYPETLPSISQRGRDRLLQEERHLSHHAHGGDQERNFGAEPLGRGEPPAGVSGGQGAVLQADEGSAQLRAGVGEGTHAGAAGDLRPGSLALQSGG
ncbi:MAG: ABC transporter substrate-binding protein [Deltaproteobacteria bacterium]|nr:ABC transporter substrate-binding protein [Deltaproteobacteria bacterium]